MKFEVGDKVRLTRDYSTLKVGTEGVISEVHERLADYPYRVRFSPDENWLLLEHEIEAVEMKSEFKPGDTVRVVTTYRGDYETETELDGQLAEYVRFDPRDDVLAHFIRVDGETTWVTEVEAVKSETPKTFKIGDKVRFVCNLELWDDAGVSYSTRSPSWDWDQVHEVTSTSEIGSGGKYPYGVAGWHVSADMIELAEDEEPEETVSKKALVEALEAHRASWPSASEIVHEFLANHGINLSELKKTKRVRVEFDVEGEVVYDRLPQYWDGQPIKNVTVEVLDD